MLNNKLSCCPRKTVIVLDRTAKFLAPSKQHIDLDSGGKRGAGKKVSGGLVYKSLWTCCVEAAVEYSRILYDLFPSRHLVQVIVSDETSHPLNTWTPEQQCVPQLLKSLAHIGPPKEQAEENCSIMHGVTAAVQALCQPLPAKIQKATTEEDKQSRIICITNLKSEAHVNTLVACVNDAIRSAKTKSSNAGTSLQNLENLDLVLVHVFQGDSNKFSEKKPKGSASLSLSTHSIKGSQMVVKLNAMVQRHFTLRSTIVTGIPMKEEQHSGSSANYDVEILHAAGAHCELNILNDFCGSNANSQASSTSKKDTSSNKETIILKWCTPKNSSTTELQPCVGAFRVTPVEVNSRPVACLTSFLLQGRNVMLEQPKKTGNKVISHILASHGGDIFIHSLAMSRTPLEDPPSISEGCGGRVTDYRINDFGEFMKANRLAPWTKKKGKNQLEKGLARLERSTRHWPMVISDTVLCNMTQLLEPLPTLVVKETLTEDEVLDCKRVIYRIQAMESRNDVLPISVSGSRGKGPKRDEQYKFLWNELQVFLEVASKTSRNHEKVLDCLKGPQSPPHSENSSPRRDTATEGMEVDGSVSTTELAWKEIGKYENMTERERTDFLRGDTNNEHFYKRGRGTPDTEQTTKKKRVEEAQDSSNKTGSLSSAPSLLSLWTNKMNSLASRRHEEFSGRLDAKGNQAELYGHMNVENNVSERGTSVKEWV